MSDPRGYMPESSHEICRICLSESKVNNTIKFINVLTPDNKKTKLSRQVFKCLNVNITKHDQKTKVICEGCHAKLLSFCQFKKLAKSSNTIAAQYVIKPFLTPQNPEVNRENNDLNDEENINLTDDEKENDNLNKDGNQNNNLTDDEKENDNLNKDENENNNLSGDEEDDSSSSDEESGHTEVMYARCSMRAMKGGNSSGAPKQCAMRKTGVFSESLKTSGPSHKKNQTPRRRLNHRTRPGFKKTPTLKKPTAQEISSGHMKTPIPKKRTTRNSNRGTKFRACKRTLASNQTGTDCKKVKL